ncbi:MAG: ABC transporter permease [Bifidobacteriaceae bacterium]|jgi:ribose/xylose/arabinose/galactoside ABC-type transport system permease subunit|nr:ABC transporter permease [Bifidobacteriaceae bacterium]
MSGVTVVDHDSATGRLRRLIPQSNTAIAGVLLVAVTILFTATTRGILISPASLNVLATFGPEICLITIAMGMVLLVGEMDLSVGSIYVVSSVVLGALFAAGWPLWLCIAAAIVGGAAMGVVNGMLVVATGVTSFVITLGTMWAFRGLMLVVLGGGTLSVYPKGGAESWFSAIAGRVLGVPAQVLWLAGIVGVLAFVRHKASVGSWLQAVGSNPRAARMMGVPTASVRVFAFALSGTLCSIAGVIQVAHSHQAVPQSGDSVMLTALAGAIVGGVALTGGRGDVLGPLLGGLTLRVISNGLVMMGVIEYWTNVLTAVAIIATAFAFHKLNSSRARRGSA